MPWVYILRGKSGRHYIGSAKDYQKRLEDHRRGNTHTTKRLGGELAIVAVRQFDSIQRAREVEAMLKRWKSPQKSIAFLTG